MRYPSADYESKLGERVYTWEDKQKRAEEREKEAHDRLARRQQTREAAPTKYIQDLLNPVIGGLNAASDTSAEAGNRRLDAGEAASTKESHDETREATSTKENKDLVNPVIGGLTAASDTSSQAANYYFLVDVDRGQGQKIGLQFDMQGRVTHLGTEETSIGEWNRNVCKTFPDAAVQLGDIIVSVSESRDICEMQSLISKDSICSFELLVRRKRDGPFVGGGGSSDEPPPPTTDAGVIEEIN